MTKPGRISLLALTATIGALTALPALAHAGETLTRAGGVLTVTGTVEEDDVQYGVVSGKLRIQGGLDGNGITLGPGSGCAYEPDGFGGFNQDAALCDMPAKLVVELGAGDDSSTPGFEGTVPTIPMELHGGSGSDWIEGGDGNDRIELGVSGGLSGSQRAEGHGGDDTVISIANDEVYGDQIEGGPGNDTVEATGTGSDVDGGPGDDVVSAGGRDALIDGGAGNDKLTIGGAESTVFGGSGADTITGSTYADTIRGGVFLSEDDGVDGDDVIKAGGGDDTINGEAGNDELYGEAGNDELSGGSGNDLVDGGAGNDELESLGVGRLSPENDGNDTYVGGAGRDELAYDPLNFDKDPIEVTLDGTANDGRVGKESDNVGGDIEEFTLGAGDDKFVGNDLAQTVYAYDGDDNPILGMGGDDVLDGGAGDDGIDGGAGNDKIQGGKLNDILVGGPGKDEILADDGCTFRQATDGVYYYVEQCFAGNDDEIQAADGEVDEIFCYGAGAAGTAAVDADFAVVDKFDKGYSGCKQVKFGSGGKKPARSLTLAYSKKAKAFKGKIKSKQAACRKGTVKIFKKKGKKKTSLGKAKANKKGSFRLSARAKKGKYLASVKKSKGCPAAKAKLKL